MKRTQISTNPNNMMPTYPARPRNGGYLTESNINPHHIYRPKVDGDRVLLNIVTEEMFNRHGERYTKGKDIRIDCIRDFLQQVDPHTPWVDIEWMNKHKRWKGTAFIIDLPFRGYTFGEMMKRLGSVARVTAVNHGILPLDCYEAKDMPRIWHELKRQAKEFMEKDGETTPVIEGVVSVARDSSYPVQIRSPKEKCPFWVKHRFAN